MKMNQTGRDIPTIPRWVTIWNSYRFVQVPLDILNGHIKKYGDTARSYIGGIYRSLLTTNPEIIQHILQKNHRNYKKSPLQFDRVAHYLGNGLLTSEGEYCLRQRRLIQPGFHRQRLEGLTRIMLEVIDESMMRMEADARRGEPVDLYPHMMETAFRIIARSIFSTTMDERELHTLSSNITDLQAFVIREIRQPFLRPWLKLNGQVSRHEQMSRVSDNILRRYIHARQASGETRDDLLQMLLDARYEDTGEGMTERQLLDEAMVLMVAGHETSACALSWIWYLLGRHPEVVERLLQEYEEVLGDRRPSFQDLPRLEYTLQVIEESMRLYPPAWITNRESIQDDHVAGVDIPAGTTLVIYIYGAHHSPEHWKDPERFDPDRFSKENKRLHTPFSYLPFGGGPRLCIGNNFALMEMQLVLAQMLRRFRFRLVSEQPVSPLPLITMRPKEPVLVNLYMKS